MTTKINNSVGIWGVRGGVGCTTTAILLARSYLARFPEDRVQVTDFACNGGFGPMLGQVGHPLNWEPQASRARRGVSKMVSVGDCGVYDDEDSRPEVFDKNYLVLRGPDYIGLRTLSAYDTAAREVFDGIIVVLESGRALGSDDVRTVTNMPVTTVRWEQSIARAADAGLLTARPQVSRFDI